MAAAGSAPAGPPPLWIAEVTSGLRRAVWESVLAPSEAKVALTYILQLPVTLVSDDRLAPAALQWAQRLQQKRAYDAFYVALAESADAELWSTDRRLVRSLQQRRHRWTHWIGELEA